MSEQGMRQRVVKALKSLDAISVENSVYPGTPDVNYIGGWIELKWVRSWPKRESTPLRLPHFTPQQRVWLQRRERKGGHAFVFLQVANDYLLFDASTAADLLGETPRHELLEAALWTATGTSALSRLREYLLEI